MIRELTRMTRITGVPPVLNPRDVTRAEFWEFLYALGTGETPVIRGRQLRSHEGYPALSTRKPPSVSKYDVAVETRR